LDLDGPVFVFASAQLVDAQHFLKLSLAQENRG
jgi:hypothetical protein